MDQKWLVDEMKTLDLNDARLDAACVALLEAFAKWPNFSIPATMLGKNELTRAYRFFDNPKVSPTKILQPHYGATAARCAGEKIVLCPQDTSELDFSRPKQQVAGAGPLDGSSRRGGFLHLVEAFTVNGVPLGAVDAKFWARDEPTPDQPKLSESDKRKKRLATPFQEKESYRWLEGFHATEKLASACPDTTYISLCDSEADMFEMFLHPRTANFHWIIRACQDRPTLDENGDTPGVIRDALRAQPLLFTNTITIRAHEAKVACETRSRRMTRVSRQAVMEVRAGQVTLKPPARCRVAGSVTLNAVLVCEASPPEDEPPVEWILLTTLPISTKAEVRQVIQYYTVRWMIEVYFRTLKTGCRVEQRRFETLDRMLACTAIYLIVAWRTMLVCRLGRECPDLDCDALFEASEWQAVWAVTHRGQPIPERPPKLFVMLRLVASLGGYVDRPNRPDPPGEETVWRGLQRTHDLALAWDTFGPDAPPTP